MGYFLKLGTIPTINTQSEIYRTFLVTINIRFSSQQGQQKSVFIFFLHTGNNVNCLSRYLASSCSSINLGLLIHHQCSVSSCLKISDVVTRLVGGVPNYR